jgi:hypothetical protein
MLYHDVDERDGGLFAPGALLPIQYFDRLRRRTDCTGEQQLMIAMLESGVDDYLKYAAARDPRRRTLFADAEKWIESDRRSWLYDFGTICDHLGLDTQHLRAGLRRLKARARGETRLRLSCDAGETVPVPEHRRASNE